jgi:hypothetical protein
VEENIKHNAKLVIEQMGQLSGLAFGYDTDSVSWLDGYINRIRRDVDQATTDRLVSVFGSYLGECVIKCHGGYWEKKEGQWRVSFDEKNGVYPFGKVGKQFENGSEDSIKSFFEIIPIVFASSIENYQSEGKT